MKKNSYGKILKDGIITQNPVLVQVLGMCPTLAVSTRLMNGLGMGVAVTVVLIFSNLFISLLRKVIDKRIRIASFIVIIAGFVTMVEMVMKAYLPSLSESLGVYIPLIVVNCIILARAEAFASRNKPLPSVVDGIASGVGFTVAICIVSAIRELLGTGALLGYDFKTIPPIMIFTLAPGGLLVLGFVMAFCAWVANRRKERALRLASDGEGETAPEKEKPAKEPVKKAEPKEEKKEEPKAESSPLKPTIAESILLNETADELDAPPAPPAPAVSMAQPDFDAKPAEEAPVIEEAPAAPETVEPAPETDGAEASPVQGEVAQSAGGVVQDNAQSDSDAGKPAEPATPLNDAAPEPAPEKPAAEQLVFSAVEEAPTAEDVTDAFAAEEPTAEERAARRRAYLEEKEAAREKKERRSFFSRRRKSEPQAEDAPQAEEAPIEPPSFMSEAIVDIDKRRDAEKEAGENG